MPADRDPAAPRASGSSPVREKRSRKLVQPGFQLRLVGLFTAMGAAALFLQSLLVAHSFERSVARVQERGGDVLEALPDVMRDALVFSLGMLAPILFGLGILFTFRIAGPAWRMERWLRAVARGERPERLRLREGDHLTSLCEALNEAVDRLRAERAGAEPERREDRAA